MQYKRYAKILLASAMTLIIAGCGDQPQMQAPPPPTVEVIEAKDEMILPSREFVARTVAVQDVTINARVSGPLLRRAFEEGADVKQGDLLFEIDPATYQTAVNQARASLEQANAAKKVALNNYTRGEKIFADGVISAKEMDELTGRKLETEAQVENAKAALAEAQLNLSYTKINAPISGRISESFVFQGDLISPDVKMATLVEVDPIQVSFQTTERELANYQSQIKEDRGEDYTIAQLPVTMRMPNGNMYQHDGRIDFVANRVDPATGTLALRAKFPNPDGVLRPGMYVTAIVSQPSRVEALLIPQVAVQEDQLGRFVLVVNQENKIEKRLVKLSTRFGVKWRVMEGLKEGELIVVQGLQKVRPGLEVKTEMAKAMPFDTPAE